MNVTRVEFYGVHPRREFLAYALIVLDDVLVIKDLKLIQLVGRVIVAMPSKKKIDNSHEDIIYPLSPAGRELIEQAVLRAWSMFPRVVTERNNAPAK